MFNSLVRERGKECVCVCVCVFESLAKEGRESAKGVCVIERRATPEVRNLNLSTKISSFGSNSCHNQKLDLMVKHFSCC